MPLGDLERLKQVLWDHRGQDPVIEIDPGVEAEALAAILRAADKAKAGIVATRAQALAHDFHVSQETLSPGDAVLVLNVATKDSARFWRFVAPADATKPEAASHVDFDPGAVSDEVVVWLDGACNGDKCPSVELVAPATMPMATVLGVMARLEERWPKARSTRWFLSAQALPAGASASQGLVFGALRSSFLSATFTALDEPSCGKAPKLPITDDDTQKVYLTGTIRDDGVVGLTIDHARTTAPESVARCYMALIGSARFPARRGAPPQHVTFVAHFAKEGD